MDTQKKTFHCKTTTEQELTGKKILQNCRNQLYLDFPYLDEILEKAQITYAQKTEVYKVVKELGTEAVPVLVSMNLNPSLLGVLMEILTMGI